MRRLLALSLAALIALIVLSLALLNTRAASGPVACAPAATVVVLLNATVPPALADAAALQAALVNLSSLLRDYRRVDGCLDAQWAARPPAGRTVTLPGPRRPLSVLRWTAPSYAATGRTNLTDLAHYPAQFAAYFERLKQRIGGGWRDVPHGFFPRSFLMSAAKTDCNGTALIHTNFSHFAASDVLLMDYPYYGAAALDFDHALLPPRAPHHLWVLSFLYEAMSYYPAIAMPRFLELFNFSIGYHRGFFTHHYPALYMPSLRELYAKPKADGAPLNRTAPIAAFVSNCAPLNNRTEYLRELSMHIEVDSYGECLHNRDMPPHFKTAAGGWRAMLDKRRVIAHYPFTIAFENSNCYDYVTEKVFEPMLVGSVPIYMGAPNVEDFVPQDSVVRVDAFASAAALAAHLRSVLSSPERLAGYHAWRRYAVPEKLLRIAAMRPTICDVLKSVRFAEDGPEL